MKPTHPFALFAVIGALSTTPALAENAPLLVIVSPSGNQSTDTATLAMKTKLPIEVISDVSDIHSLWEQDRDFVVLERTSAVPDHTLLAHKLEGIEDLPLRLTYLMFAETASDSDPLSGVNVPENVQFVLAVNDLDRAAVAKSYATAGTGYDGHNFRYDTAAALTLASEQLKAEGTDGTLKNWTAGAYYMFFEADVLKSGAPAEAATQLLTYTSQNASLKDTWYDIDVGAFSQKFPTAAKSDMHGVYVNTVGPVCGSSYPWDGETPPQIFEDLGAFLE